MLDKTVSSIILANVLSNLCYSVVMPFLPLEMEQWGLDTKFFGWVFGIYALAGIIGSLIVGFLLPIIGRKALLITGLMAMGGSMISFGLLNFSVSKEMFFFSALVCRVLQGLSSAAIQTTSYSIVSIAYPLEKEKYIGLIEVAQGVGLSVGPVLGSLLYSHFGFVLTFIFVGGSFIICVPLLKFFVPSSINKTDESIRDSWYDPEASQRESVGILSGTSSEMKLKDLFQAKGYLLAVIAGFLSYFQFCFFEPVLAIRLLDFHLSNLMFGVVFAILPVGYILMGTSISLVSDRMSGKAIMLWGFLLSGLTKAMFGPSVLLPDSLMLMCIGHFLAGALTIWTNVPVLPEMIRCGVAKHPNKIIEVTDKSSGIFNATLGVGQMTSPLFGSYMTQWTNFRVCSDIVGLIQITFFVIYFLFGDGVYLLSSFLRNRKDTEPIRAPKLVVNKMKLQNKTISGGSESTACSKNSPAPLEPHDVNNSL